MKCDTRRRTEASKPAFLYTDTIRYDTIYLGLNYSYQAYQLPLNC